MGHKHVLEQIPTVIRKTYLLNTNFTHNFQEHLCADDRMVQHEYPLLLRLKCTGPLSLLQGFLQSNIGPLSAKIYIKGLTQLLAYGLIIGSVSCQLVDEPKLQCQILLDVAKHKCRH